MNAKKMAVFECWMQARREFPDRPDAMRMRYVELMREQGHIRDRQPGDRADLPCGWPSRRTRS